jgi:DNA-binding NarL/FixJ family response regulator
MRRPAVRAVPDLDSDDRPLSILIVHDHDVIRSGFRLLFSRQPWIRRCLGAQTVDEAVELWNRYEPHLALVDLFVGGTAGSDLCMRLRRLRPHASVLLMSSSERMSATAAIAAGAAGFISIGAPAEQLARVVHLAGLGRTVSQPPTMSLSLLSDRQREVLRLMASGATNKEIADTLCLSPHTVKGHTRELYRRLQARNRAGAVRRAQDVGLLC